MKRIVHMAPVLLMLATGCMKEELPIPARPPGQVSALGVCTGPSYQEQVWFDLNAGLVSSVNPKAEWDLKFESGADGWRIRLNGAKAMKAWNIGPVAMEQQADTAGMGAGARIDASSGHPDSTAIGDWRGTNDVYIIDLGFDHLGVAFGSRKFRFLSDGPGGYTFEMSALDGTGLTSVSVAKDATRDHTYFSVQNGVRSIEPAAWDLVFTQYMHQFHDPYIAYLVSGVLIRDGVQVARIPSKPFEQVTLADTLLFPFSTAADIIGYDWKEYSFETSSYTVEADRCYIIRDRLGVLHKLHFIDFYDDNGSPGCPKFEVVPL